MSSYETWSLVTASVMAVSTAAYVIFTMKLVSASNNSHYVMNLQRQLMLEQMNDSFINSVLQQYSNKRDMNVASNGILEIKKLLISQRKSVARSSNELQKQVTDFYTSLKKDSQLVFNSNEKLFRHIQLIWNTFLIVDKIDLSIEKKRHYYTIIFGILSLEETVLIMLSELLETANSPSLYYTVNSPNNKGLCELFRSCCPFLDNSDAQSILFDIFKNNNPRKEFFQW